MQLQESPTTYQHKKQMKQNNLSSDINDSVLKENEYVDGNVTDIVFQNEENGYTVAVIKKDDVTFTVVGIIPMLCEGEYLKACGKWTTHSTFGKQFVVESYEKQAPSSESAILAYLSSGVIKGVGAATAQRIVDKYGKDTLEVMEQHPEWLCSVKGISPKKADIIGKSFATQFGLRNVIMFFAGSLSPNFSYKVYKKWGPAAVDVVKANPYVLCDEIYGISFEKADKIASSLGIAPNSHFRLAAGIKYTLLQAMYKNGHCFLELNELLDAAVTLLCTQSNEVTDTITSLTQSGELIAVRYRETTAIYLASVYKSERFCAEKLALISKTAIIIPDCDKQQALTEAQQELKITFDELQKQAVEYAVSKGVCVVTGGPGTGKTTVIRAIIKIFDKLEISYALAAPTGRAAIRMSGATIREAKTIHRMLESEFGGENRVTFARNESNPLSFQAVIIDEMSMTDIFLMEALLKAIKPGTKLIFIGDSDQLPPVGAGDTLRDIIKSGVFPCIELKKIFRQSEKSKIVTNAHTINAGQMPELDNKSNDFFFLSRTDGKLVVDTISELCKTRLPSSYSYCPMEDIQVITPTHKGYGGTLSLNSCLQQALNPGSDSKTEKAAHGVVFRTGDKVMQIRNNYSVNWESTVTGKAGEGVFNGEIGTIKKIDLTNESFVIEFDDKLAHYDFSLFDEIEHAYAVTVHKSQGSEYPCVVLSLYDAPAGLLTRNMLYTAVTRAQKNVVIVGDKKTIEKMVANNSQFKRNTGLMFMLKKLAAGI